MTLKLSYGYVVFGLALAACSESVPTEPTANEADVAVAQAALSATRHQQTTLAGVEAWVNSTTAQRLVNVSTIGDTDSAANKQSESHFDNCYWNESRDWIIANRNQAIAAAVEWFQTGNAQTLDTVFNSLGFALHAAEDFYAHSNWVETHEPGVLAPFNDSGTPVPAGWYSGTYYNSGDSGPNAGYLHCPAGTPSHLTLNKDLAGGAAADEAFLDATLAATEQIRRFMAGVRAAMPSATAEAILTQLGFVAPSPATTTYRSDFRRVVTPSGGPWGLSAKAVYCSAGSYVAAFAQRVETPQGSLVDDTALNTVLFYCKNPTGTWLEPLNAWEGVWGTWSPWAVCQTASGFFTGGELKIEPSQGAGDDTGANASRFWCNDGSALTATNDGPWGTWRGRATCAAGEAVCGVQIQYESPQGAGDDTAMNGIRLHCCAL